MSAQRMGRTGRPMERWGAEAFDGDRLRRTGTWAVAFLADWCPFCRSFAPKFAALETGGVAKLAVADVTDEESPLWDRFEVKVVPTVIVFRDGAPASRHNGRLARGLGERDLAAISAEIASA